jgi:predicted transcriptional regulator of viral defense system
MMMTLPEKKTSSLIQGIDLAMKLKALDEKRIRVFTTGDFRKILHGMPDQKIARILTDARNSHLISSPTRGVFVYEQSEQPRTHLVYEVARTMRRGSYTYLSLESALSEYGIISQIPVNHHTFMTTGRKGSFKTPYGLIEFTHTGRDALGIIRDTVEIDRPLPIATAERALADLRRVGRNLHLVQENEIRNLTQDRREENEHDPIF